MPNPCVFCEIIAGRLPAAVLYQDERITAFQDAAPIAPVHILLVPNHHITSVNEAAPEDEMVLGHLITVARQLAQAQNLQESGYRLVINTGPDAGQSVFHLHMHLIGGRKMPLHFK